MNIIQTLYSGNRADFLIDNFGWYAPEYHLMAWALSSLQLHKYYKKVFLYSDAQSAKMLFEILELPYCSVQIIDYKSIVPERRLWALPKIYTYSLQSEPFLHIDGDVFIFNSFEQSLLNGELIAQNIEEATQYYASTQKEIVEHFSYIPECVKNDFNQSIPIKAVNAGILGGSDIHFFKNYCNEAFEYINKNVDRLSKINSDLINVFFEQHLFYCLAKEKGININCLFSEIIGDNQYQFLDEFQETPCIKTYLHLIGHYKHDEYTCIQMATKLRRLYPEYYYKIIDLFKKQNISYSLKQFYKSKFKNCTEFQLFNAKAKEEYTNSQTYKNYSKRKGFKDIKGDSVPDLVLLKNLIRNINSSNTLSINLDRINGDFDLFSKNLITFLSRQFTDNYLYGRDLKSVEWYCELFSNEKNVLTKEIICCKEVRIIKSEYNWAGILNKYKRVGIAYYEDLKIIRGQYFNLIVPELSEYLISAFDIEEIEKRILKNLNGPISIRSLSLAMEIYFEDDVILNHRDFYQNLILTLIKGLVSKKAIRSI